MLKFSLEKDMNLKEITNWGLQSHKPYDLKVLKSLSVVKFKWFEELKYQSSAAFLATICNVLGFMS